MADWLRSANADRARMCFHADWQSTTNQLQFEDGVTSLLIWLVVLKDSSGIVY